MNIDKKELRKRIDNFWYYNKWFVIIGIAVLLAVCYIAKDITSKKDEVFSAVIANCTTTGLDEFTQEYLDSTDIDQKTETVTLNTLYFGDEQDTEAVYSVQALQAEVAAHVLDAIVSDTATAQKYMRDVLEDLRDILDEDDLEYFSDHIVYYDGDSEDCILSSDTSAMTDPIPVGIVVSEASKLTSFMVRGDEYIYGFAVNSENRERAIEFLHYILE